VEHLTESRLEVELHRQLGGAAPAHLHAAGESTGPGTAAPGPGAPSPDVPVLDFESEDDDEPRTIIIRGFGPRWAEQPVLAAEGIS
jgi:tRNA threonylcarbamoyladenosine biosynthesis protein TsaE